MIVSISIFVASPSPPVVFRHHNFPCLPPSYHSPDIFCHIIVLFFFFLLSYSFHAFLYFQLLIWLICFVWWIELKANTRRHLAFHNRVLYCLSLSVRNFFISCLPPSPTLLLSLSSNCCRLRRVVSVFISVVGDSPRCYCLQFNRVRLIPQSTSLARQLSIQNHMKKDCLQKRATTITVYTIKIYLLLCPSLSPCPSLWKLNPYNCNSLSIGRSFYHCLCYCVVFLCLFVRIECRVLRRNKYLLLVLLYK